MRTIERQKVPASETNATKEQIPALRPSSAPGTAAGTDAWAAGTASCPEDCHYCSGPETD